MVAKWRLEIEIAMGHCPVPISVSSRHFALRYEVPKFLARGGHLCMAVLTIAVLPTVLQLYVHVPERDLQTHFSSCLDLAS